MLRQLFTSESVSEGHPDKICDQISDAILDAILGRDPQARVACEALVTTGQVVIAGELRTKVDLDADKIARVVIRNIGYNDPRTGFDADSCKLLNCLHVQSSDIAQGVDEGKDKELGAGDQGLMFGFAVNETPALMPMPIMLSHQLLQKLSRLRNSGQLSYLRPDAKSQVTVEYNNGVPTRIDAVVLSTQHTEDVDLETLRHDIKQAVIMPTIGEHMLDKDTKFFINPAGRFVIGGPKGDCGLTGRKIIVDTYGGMGRHGGGCFSGKDPSKVDRSGSYAARYIAKNIVAAGLADKCEVQLSYAIGVAEPVSIFIDTFGSDRVHPGKLAAAVRQVFPTKPADIIRTLKLLHTKYLPTATYGHFGKAALPWEQVDKKAALLNAL